LAISSSDILIQHLVPPTPAEHDISVLSGGKRK
jgi:hypothetical protein